MQFHHHDLLSEMSWGNKSKHIFTYSSLHMSYTSSLTWMKQIGTTLFPTVLIYLPKLSCVCGPSEPSASPAKDNYRMNRYKNKALNPEEMRRRREEEGIQLRKQKREQQVLHQTCPSHPTAMACIFCGLWQFSFKSQLFKRRNVDVLNEEEAMFESPLVDSYLSSPVTVSVVFF